MPAGWQPAKRGQSTAASVWPAPAGARRPGTRGAVAEKHVGPVLPPSSFQAPTSVSAMILMVRARSAALMPVVIAARGVHAHVEKSVRKLLAVFACTNAVNAQLVEAVRRPAGTQMSSAPEFRHKIDPPRASRNCPIMINHPSFSRSASSTTIDHFAFADVGDDGFNAVKKFFFIR